MIPDSCKMPNEAIKGGYTKTSGMLYTYPHSTPQGTSGCERFTYGFVRYHVLNLAVHSFEAQPKVIYSYSIGTSIESEMSYESISLIQPPQYN